MNHVKSTLTSLILLFSISTGKTQSILDSGEHFASVRGNKIHYIVAGKGPICLLPSPGWGVSIKYLRRTLYPFEKYFTMVYYDTRLTGLSTGPSDSTKYSTNDFMLDMDSLRIFLKQSKVWVMGHSAGGFQCLYYGIHHDEHLNGIIIIDSYAVKDSLYWNNMRTTALKRKGQPYYAKSSGLILGTDTTNYSVLQIFWLTLPYYFYDQKNVSKAMNSGIADVSMKANNYVDVSGFQKENLLPFLNNITVPTLVITGDDDFLSGKSQADRIISHMKSATELIITNAGHLCWIEQPEQFFTASSKWLIEQNVKEN